MSLKRGGAPKTIPATLTIKGQGVTDKLNIVYHNRKGTEVRQLLEKDGDLAKIVPFIVESWDTDFELTEEGVRDFEDEHAGIALAVLEGFWKARRKELEGN